MPEMFVSPQEEKPTLPEEVKAIMRDGLDVQFTILHALLLPEERGHPLIAGIGDGKKLCEIIEMIQDFILRSFDVNTLLDSFRNSPGQRIHGARGVAVLLGQSRIRVYQRLQLLGLDAEDFREPHVRTIDLIAKSGRLGPTMALIQKLRTDLASVIVLPRGRALSAA